MTAMVPPMAWIATPGSAMPRVLMTTGAAASRMPMTTSATDSRDSGRQVGSGATSKLTSISPASAAFSSRIRPSSARSRSTEARMTGSGFGRRMRARQHGDLRGDVDRLAIALVLLARGVALGGDPLGLAGLVEQAAAFGQDGPRRRPVGRARPTACRGRARAGRAPARPGRGRPGPGSTACSATLSRPGFRSPLRGQVVERLVELLARPARAAVGAADRRLEAVAQGAFVARQVGQLEVVDRRRRAEEALGRDPGQLGHDLVGERRVGDRLALVLELDRPLRARERLLERADLRAVLVVLLELDGDDRPRLGRRVPRPERLELAGGARHPPGQGQLEGALDGRLAGLVRAADDGQPGRELDVEACDSAGSRDPGAGGPSQRDLVAGEQQATEPERVALLGGLGGRAGRLELARSGPRGRG